MKANRLPTAQRVDLITTLPRAVIETILCFLPIEEAARTSILSREWRYKWTTIPILEFSQDTIKSTSATEQSSCTLFYAIQQVLLLRTGPIHEFALSLEARNTHYEIDQIILHLSMNHTVKKLAFNFCDTGGNYGLPVSFFSLHHLTELNLEYCNFKHKPIFNGFSSLTRLSLKHIWISKESLLHLLSNCPSLKSLSLLLVEEDFTGDKKPNIMEILKCLPMVEHLTTWGYIIRLKFIDPEELPTSLIHLKYVCIRQICFVDAYGLPFLAVLTESCPNLEKIKLEIDTDRRCDDADMIKPVALGKCCDVWLEHLKEVEIDYFTNSKPEREFVKFMLDRSPNIKKVILLTWIGDKSEEVEMLNNYILSSRASSVEIIVKNRFTD